MPPEEKCCENPEQCPPVRESKLRWEQVQKEYNEVKEDLKEVGANVSQTNIHLAEQNVRLENLAGALDKYSDVNTANHDFFYNKGREAEERLTKIETAQASAPHVGAEPDSEVMKRLRELETGQAASSAVKKSTWEIIKWATGLGVLANLGDIISGVKALF
jgi:chromosome segregation ATPase